MSLYVVQHTHSEETCPAGHPDMGPMLVQHVSPSNAEKYGVKVHGDAVVNGAHRFVLILEAAGEDNVKQFMAPFYQAGSVEILPANTCEVVVERGRC